MEQVRDTFSFQRRNFYKDVVHYLESDEHEELKVDFSQERIKQIDCLPHMRLLPKEIVLKVSLDSVFPIILPITTIKMIHSQVCDWS